MEYIIVVQPLGTTLERCKKIKGTVLLEEKNDPRIISLYPKGNIVTVTENNYTYDGTVICINKMYENSRIIQLV